MSSHHYVYILTNKNNSVFYTGTTRNLHARLIQHQAGQGSLFCKKYNVSKLVYIDHFNSVFDAVWREKQIKRYSRAKKLKLITRRNPEFLALDIPLS